MDNHQPGKRIAIITFSDIKKDPRISRVADLFLDQGHQVRVYTITREADSRSEDFGSIRIHSISVASTETYNLDTRLFFEKIGTSLEKTFCTLWPEVFIVDTIRIQPGDNRELLKQLYRQTLNYRQRNVIRLIYERIVAGKTETRRLTGRMFNLIKKLRPLPRIVQQTASSTVYLLNVNLSRWTVFRSLNKWLKILLGKSLDLSTTSTESATAGMPIDSQPVPIKPLSNSNRETIQRNVDAPLPELTAHNNISAINALNRDIASTKQILQINILLDEAIDGWPTHIYSNDLETLFAGVMAKTRLDAKLIYDAHEIWPQQWTIDYRSGAFVGFFSNAERALLNHTDLRITIGTGLGKYFEYCYASKPFVIIPNTPRLIDNNDVQSRSLELGDVRLIYHGVYAPERGFEQIIYLAEELERCKIFFRGVGVYGEFLKELVDKRGLNHRIKFLPPVATEDLAKSALDFDIGLIPAVNSCINTNFGFPNKLFEYMSAGLAIATTNLIDLRDFVTTYNLGVVFDINDRNDTIRQINNLILDRERLNECKRNSRRIAESEYNWQSTSKKLLSVLPSVEL